MDSKILEIIRQSFRTIDKLIGEMEQVKSGLSNLTSMYIKNQVADYWYPLINAAFFQTPIDYTTLYKEIRNKKIINPDDPTGDFVTIKDKTYFIRKIDEVAYIHSGPGSIKINVNLSLPVKDTLKIEEHYVHDISDYFPHTLLSRVAKFKDSHIVVLIPTKGKEEINIIEEKLERR